MTKRFLMGCLLAFFVLATTPASVSATTADWDLCGANSGEFIVYYNIDINSLFINSFTMVNNSSQPGYAYVKKDGVYIFEMVGNAYTKVTQPISNFKLNRVPASDHDDPNSVRIPSGVTLGCRWPAF